MEFHGLVCSNADRLVIAEGATQEFLQRTSDRLTKFSRTVEETLFQRRLSIGAQDAILPHMQTIPSQTMFR